MVYPLKRERETSIQIHNMHFHITFPEPNSLSLFLSSSFLFTNMPTQSENTHLSITISHNINHERFTGS
ncbi:hypothetical protein LOK49_LG08G02435 [Camellia lanceoleosa]|uniref:Uncharacterized protein n=1 Tax=Camellia lanceoleosa TaxID=1840588 RepID=A0ACC0GVM8_9ERIC|nr:hypothetical protein LOK49_LG08G02435 [Camellia lanceoleosa]